MFFQYIGLWRLLPRRSLEYQLKELREEQDELMAGQRASRIAKWIQYCSEAREKAGLEPLEKLKSLDISLFNTFQCYPDILLRYDISFKFSKCFSILSTKDNVIRWEKNFYRMNVMLFECMLSLAFNSLMLAAACWPQLFLSFSQDWQRGGFEHGQGSGACPCSSADAVAVYEKVATLRARSGHVSREVLPRSAPGRSESCQ